jgi:transposase
MILNLSQLRADYKIIRKKNYKVAAKIELLIEITKVDLKYQNQTPQNGKKIYLTDLLIAKKIKLRTLQRWKNNYRTNGLDGISDKKRGHKLKIELSQEIKDKIYFYREKFRWGSEVLQAHLLLDDGFKISRYKIDRFLKDSGLLKSHPCTTIKRQKALKKKKHIKKVVVEKTGQHTQMDVKYQLHLLENKEKAYVYNFVDHASNWSYKRAYSRINTNNTEDFMEKIMKACPFKIKRLQTDNGVEFTFKWISEYSDDPKVHPLMKFCHLNEIKHKLIPPGEKELQGLVERSHRQDDQELFSMINPHDLD